MPSLPFVTRDEAQGAKTEWHCGTVTVLAQQCCPDSAAATACALRSWRAPDSLDPVRATRRRHVNFVGAGATHTPSSIALARAASPVKIGPFSVAATSCQAKQRKMDWSQKSKKHRTTLPVSRTRVLNIPAQPPAAICRSLHNLQTP